VTWGIVNSYTRPLTFILHADDLGDEAPLLLLLFNGDPLDITFAQQSPQVNAIISCVYPAQATGDALYRTLTMTGPQSVPAARLPNTWPAQLHQVMLLLSITDVV